MKYDTRNRQHVEAIDSLKRAFWQCTQWRMEHGLFIGDGDGWHIVLARDHDGSAAGKAANNDLNIVINLTPGVADAWLKVAQTKLPAMA